VTSWTVIREEKERLHDVGGQEEGRWSGSRQRKLGSSNHREKTSEERCVPKVVAAK
jgi:hypothetical protein